MLQVLNSLIDTETMNLGAVFWKAIYNKFVNKQRKENNKVHPSSKFMRNIAKLCGCFLTLAIQRGKKAIHSKNITSMPIPKPLQKLSKIIQYEIVTIKKIAITM